MPIARWPTAARCAPRMRLQRRRRASARAATSMLDPAAALDRRRHPGRPRARAPTFGLDNALATRFWTAVKTGTSKDMRDNWCIGFSRPLHGGRMGRQSSRRADARCVRRDGRSADVAGHHEPAARGAISHPPKPPRDIVMQERCATSPPSEPPRREAFLPGTQMDLVALPEIEAAHPHMSARAMARYLRSTPTSPPRARSSGSSPDPRGRI